jgi:homoserine dehydrogenase
VISDISAASYDYRYEYKKLNRGERYSLGNDHFLKIYVSFNNWSEVNKWDFEQVIEYHGTEERQYITGLIKVDKLKEAAWFQDPAVSIILLPDEIAERSAVVATNLKKVSLQLAGVN